MAIILIFKNSKNMQSHPLKGKETTIGRSRKADITIEDIQLSSVHCEISLNDNVIEFRDLNSTNGTFLNNTVATSGKLYIGDVLKIGKTLIKIDKDSLSKSERELLIPGKERVIAPQEKSNKNDTTESHISLHIEVPVNSEETKTKSESQINTDSKETISNISLGTQKLKSTGLADKLENEGYTPSGATQFIKLDKESSKKNKKINSNLDFKKTNQKETKKKSILSKLISSISRKEN